MAASLTRRVAFVCAASVALAVAAAWMLHVAAVRDRIESDRQATHQAAAEVLAAALSAVGGDTRRLDAALAAAAPADGTLRVRLTRGDTAPAAERNTPARPASAPAWWVRIWDIEPAAGVAAVRHDGVTVATLEVAATAAAHDALWHTARAMLAASVAVALAALALAGVVVWRLGRPWRQLHEQATQLALGQRVQVDVPAHPELRAVAESLNAAAQRTRALFEAQAAQIDALRRQATCDADTGLLHRAAFVEQVHALLGREDGPASGSLVIVRLADLAGLNRTLGRESADRAVRVVAELVQAYPARVGDCLAARLNGADFALLLPAPGMAAETAESIAGALASALAGIGRHVHVHVGAVEFAHTRALGELLAAADLALARAEADGPFGIHVVAADSARHGGEHHWFEAISEALAQRRVQLGAQPVLDAQRRVVHVECPLRLQLRAGGPFEPASHWLPLAQRSERVPEADLCAITLALEAIAGDARPRAVHVGAASLADGGFAMRVQHRLRERPPPAGRLWLDVPERMAVEQFELLQRFAQLVRPLGVRVGLAHAGLRLTRIERLYELGVDHVKLDASLCAGVASSEVARHVVRATVALLRPLSLRVFAEGVADARDAAVLFDLGLDGVGGAWAHAPAAPAAAAVAAPSAG
ncbi:EAL domain-containing protein [Calidifontimicrobium sp. SYSU G02091]|uniref:EAL domain-containing protein n=1 Tax=Calidifontimicrobium sp. SYSU G02091 TaxID=2926421 RepID=UPI001F52CAF6|nr:EAL domain-containing protein [Calidifontimicrobium sp. SYSU G02091]MCI1191947.1 EAL domain-containing protein [Calidifontimicrobium sp. SYSU G02091]